METVLQEKPVGILRERAVAPKVNVRQTFEELLQQTIGLVHMRVVPWFPRGDKQARNDAAYENVSHTRNTRYAKSETNNRHHGGFGSRTEAAEIVGPEIENHGVWRKFPDEIELRWRGKDVARLVVLPDVEHEGENGRFLEREIVPGGIARNEIIQAADVAVAEHENDRRLVVEIDGTAGWHGWCARNRHCSRRRNQIKINRWSNFQRIDIVWYNGCPYNSNKVCRNTTQRWPWTFSRLEAWTTKKQLVWNSLCEDI